MENSKFGFETILDRFQLRIFSRPVGNVKMNVVWGKPTTEMKMKALVAKQRNALMTFPKDPPMESNHNE